jgi:hypothetical protein
MNCVHRKSQANLGAFVLVFHEVDYLWIEVRHVAISFLKGKQFLFTRASPRSISSTRHFIKW